MVSSLLALKRETRIFDDFQQNRAIPACAGKSSFPFYFLFHLLGSPPRVRGKESDIFFRHFSVRITPACAGKSIVPSAVGSSTRDHPRVCGEKSIRWLKSSMGTGSPPRVRGKALPGVIPVDQRGITPACAGKRRGLMKMICWRGDHPRVCGEKFSLFFLVAETTGSPPRVRGKGLWVPGHRPRSRITPACAGKSGISPP